MYKLRKYYINGTVNYTNPGNELHQWLNQQSKELRVFDEVLSFIFRF